MNGHEELIKQTLIAFTKNVQLKFAIENEM